MANQTVGTGLKKGADLGISVFNIKHSVQKLYPLFAFQLPHTSYFYKSVLVDSSFLYSYVVYYM